jgi:anti-sigma factor RsiW
MSTMNDKLEIVIGKFLDGEISPAEQRWLDDELQRNDQARELLDQLRTLNECGRQAVASEVLEQGRGPEEILELTRQRHQISRWRRLIRADGHRRFAAGLAAGLVLGLILHFVLISGNSAGTKPVDRSSVAGGVPVRANPDEVGEVRVSNPRPVMRNVDWYGFTDRSGQQWLVEGIREGSVQPAVYYGDL